MSVRNRALGYLGCLVAVAIGTLVMARPAQAYCVATTCTAASCPANSQGCVVDGDPLTWRSSCITLNLQAEAAPKAGIGYDDARASLERAAEAWMSVVCPGGGHPSIDIKIADAALCSSPEYNPDKRNANVVLFREDEWPHAGKSADALGYTNLSFDSDTGALFDADIELNAIAETFAVGRLPKSNEADLDSVVTHELGHLLGLGHSSDVTATMVGGYVNGTYELRTPAADDIAGICAIYPPRRQAETDSCEPRHGFSELCGADQVDEPMTDGGDTQTDATSRGCAFAQASAARSAWVAPIALLAVFGLLRRRKARRVSQSMPRLIRDRFAATSLVACAVAVGCSRLTAPDWALIPPPSSGNAGNDDAGGAPSMASGGEPSIAGRGGADPEGGAAGAGGDDGEGTAGTGGTAGMGGGGTSAGGRGGTGGGGGGNANGGTGGGGGNANGGGSGGMVDPDSPTPCTGAPGPITGSLVLFAGPAKPTAARGGRTGLDADCEAERVKLALPQTKTHAFIGIDDANDYIARWKVLFPDLPMNQPIVGPTGIQLAPTWDELLRGRGTNSLVCAKVLPEGAFWWLSGSAYAGFIASTGEDPVFGQGVNGFETCEGWTQGTHDPLHGARPGSAQIGGSRLFSYNSSKTFNINCDSTARFAIVCLAYTP